MISFRAGSPRGHIPSGELTDTLPIYKAHAAVRGFFGVTVPRRLCTAVNQNFFSDDQNKEKAAHNPENIFAME